VNDNGLFLAAICGTNFVLVTETLKWLQGF